MKSIADVKKANLMGRLGILSLVTFMALTVSMGRAVAAIDDFKLWKRDAAGARVKLNHLNEEEKTQARQWLATERNATSVKLFVTNFQSEPFKFVEGVRLAAKRALQTGQSNFDGLKRDLPELLKDINESHFGRTSLGHSQKEALLKVVDRVLSLTADELHNLADEDVNRRTLDPLTQLLLALEDRPAPTPAPTTSPNPRVVTPGPGVGENPNDFAQQCEAIRRMIRDSLKPLEDLTAQNLQSLIEASKAPNIAKRDQGDAFKDILAPALAKALNGDDEKQTAPTPPQVAPQQPNQQKQNDPSVFGSQIPEKEPREEQAVQPMQIPPVPDDVGPMRVATNIPTDIGRAASKQSKDLLARLAGRTSMTETMMGNLGWRQTMLLKKEPQELLNETNSVLARLNDDIDRGEETLERSKQGAESSLDPKVKTYKAQLEGEIQEKTQELNDIRQSAGQAGNDQNLRAQIASQVNSIMGELRNKKATKKKLEAAITAAVDSGNDQIALLKKRMDQMNDTKTQLEQKRNSLKSEVSALDESARMAFEQEKAMSTGNVGAAAPNVNRLGSVGAGYPRGTSPSSLGLGTAMIGAKSGTSRGPLRGIGQ